jgi:iron complex outermembrane receptor protein
VNPGQGPAWPSRAEKPKAILNAIVVAVALMGIVSPAEAQESQDLTSLSPEELVRLPTRIVTTASKYLNRITDAPAAVSIVTAEDIRLYGYRTLAEVLNSVGGISISYDRNYTYLGLRGLPGQATSTPGSSSSSTAIA